MLASGQAMEKPISKLRGLVRMGLVVMSLVCLGVVAVTLLRGAGIAGQGSTPACVSAPTGAARFNGSGGPLEGLRPGATFFAESFNVCSSHPSAGQDVLLSLSTFPFFLLLAVLFYLGTRTLSSAAEGKPYTLRVVRHLNVFAWACLAGGILASLIEAGAKVELFNSLTVYHTGIADAERFWSFPWATTLAALGVYALARTVRSAVSMSDDLEGTV